MVFHFAQARQKWEIILTLSSQAKSDSISWRLFPRLLTTGSLCSFGVHAHDSKVSLLARRLSVTTHTWKLLWATAEVRGERPRGVLPETLGGDVWPASPGPLLYLFLTSTISRNLFYEFDTQFLTVEADMVALNIIYKRLLLMVLSIMMTENVAFYKKKIQGLRAKRLKNHTLGIAREAGEDKSGLPKLRIHFSNYVKITAT